MNPQIKLTVLTVYTILAASASSRLRCDARSAETRQLLADIPSPNSPIHPLSQPPLRQNGPPLCVYPPPAAATLPPPLHTPSSPSLSQPTPSSPYAKPDHSNWCVAKPNMPVSSMQQALDYACASGADCGPIQLNGVCFKPDTVVAHASYAFNSYWQKTKKAGGTCDFGGSATLVTVDPSYDQCHFISS